MSELLTMQDLANGHLDVKALGEAANGDENTIVTTRTGNTYPSAERAINIMFQNGGLPPLRYATLLELQINESADGAYAFVADDEMANNGIYIRKDGVWLKSKYDVKESILSDIDKKLSTDASSDLVHAFVDKNSRLLASIDKSGKFDLELTDESKAKVNDIKKDANAEKLGVVLDKDNRVLLSIDKSGKFDLELTEESKASVNDIKKDNNTEQLVVIVDKNNKVLMSIPPFEAQGGVDDSSVQHHYPINSAQPTVFIKSLEKVSDKLSINTIAKGRPDDPDIVVNGDGITHPKMIYIPGGWNGYAYWLAATPVFGVIPSAAYENPHVFASNDLVTWVEPSGAPIDLPEDNGKSYWSDTHLELGDDGYLYCWYRGNGFSYNGRFVVYKRSKDGVIWSDSVVVNESSLVDYNVSASNLLLSPAVHRDGSMWVCYDLIRSDSLGMELEETSSTTLTHTMRRTFDKISDSFGKYDPSQTIKYSPRLWGVESDPWHIEAIKVGNLYLHLLATGGINFSTSEDLYLCWSTDGWNFNVLPKLETGDINDYRSSLTVVRASSTEVELKLLNAKRDGRIKLYNLTIGVN